MATAQDRLNQILPSWYDLLTQWSLDGSLVAAATDALMLDSSNAKEGSKGQLQSYVSQWSAGNFQNLPKIVLLSAEDISGARGAYAASTDTIYLNQDWLLGANAEDIQKVLTEELGHYLDDQLNSVDTQGDEGEYFSFQLFNGKPDPAQAPSLRTEADDILINNGISAEAAQSQTIIESRINQYIATTNIPDIARLSNGNLVVSWWSYGQDGSGWSVAARVLSPSGAPVSNEFLVNTYTANEQANPSIAALANGNFVITWQSQGGESGSGYTAFGCFGQLFDQNGNKIGQQFQINTFTSDNQAQPVVTPLNDGGFATAWFSYTQDGSGGGVYGQNFNADGTKNGAEYRINTIIPGFQEAAEIATLENGNYVVTWANNIDSVMVGNGYYFNLYSSDGTLLVAQSQISSNSILNNAAAVTALGNAGFAVSWTDSTSRDGSQRGIYLKIYSNTGQSITSDILVNQTTSGNQQFSDITYLGGNRILVSWSSDSTSSNKIYAREFSVVDGSPLSGEYVVNSIPTSAFPSVCVTSDKNGTAFFAWSTSSISTSTDGLYFSVQGAAPTFINGNSLYTTTNGPGWTSARQAALGLGGDLTSINSALENQFLLNSFGQYLNEAWIGFSDSTVEGTWTWSDGSAVEYTNWNYTQPSGSTYGDPSEDYGAIYFNGTDWSYGSQPPGSWNDCPDYGAYLFSLDPYFSTVKGIAELAINSTINAGNIIEGGGSEATVTLTAGTQNRSDLFGNIPVYWSISGVLSGELTSGAAAGSGTLVNGQLKISTSLNNYLSSSGGQLAISIFSDPDRLHQIGITSTKAITYIDNGNAVFSITGTPAVGNLLTATNTAADPDGNGTFSYSWQTSTNGSSWSTVGTASTYTVAANDEGKQLQLVVSYTDLQGFGEVITTSGGTIPFVQSAKLIGDALVNTDLIGTDSDDRMSGKGVPTTGGQDIIDGKGGINDVVFESGNYNFKISGTSTASTVVGSTTTKSGTKTITTTYINDSITNVEGVEVTGGTSANTLDASTYSGRANLNGDSGADTIIGGTGADVLTGGLGADIFRFAVKPTSLTAATADRITDFKSAESDKIQVARTVFGISSTAKVTFTATSATQSLTKALGTANLFVLDASTGYLYYNANGTAADAGSLGGVFAVLDKINGIVPTLTASNIALI